MELLKDDRLKKIIDLLHEKRAVTTAELRHHLGVSSMTIHRDLSALVATGQVERVHGGVMLVGEHNSRSVCAHCGKTLNPRTAFILHLSSGDMLQACCPHCGLRLLDMHSDAVSGLVADFLNGTMSSIKETTYLVMPDLTICCQPSVLAFANRQDAERMRAGFGGMVLDFKGAGQALRKEMDLHQHSIPHQQH